MPKTDTGIATVWEAGLHSDEAQGFEHLAAESRRLLYERRVDQPSPIEVFSGPAQEAEIVAEVERIQAKPEQSRLRSEREYLARHASIG
jgi:hypothetical protein